jgi:HPt (histidine-containing phosphotransfer) domain-containing protein
MVDSYEGTAAETVPQIRAAIAAGDPLALEDAAYKFKGVAANLGVRDVHDATARLVALARSGTTAGGDAIFGELEAALAPASAALQELLAIVGAGAAQPADLDLFGGQSPGAGRVAAR